MFLAGFVKWLNQRECLELRSPAVMNQFIAPDKISKSFLSRLAEDGLYSEDIKTDLLSIFIMIDVDLRMMLILIGR